MIQVAGYCRVSTDKMDQANSLASQCRYFREYIERNPDWQLYKIYADEGITGTSTKKRVQFNRMMDDAYEGKFQLILTKEVSRFSRNILDTISYTRELKAQGIGVVFLTDGICSMDADSELRLSIMSSIAQEESRKTSNRVKWGQTRQMERGVVFGRSLLGYQVCNGVLTVKEEEAKIVRWIFCQYAMENKSAAWIARQLQEMDCRTGSGSKIWRASYIIKLLNNEKYVGDLVQKKTVTMDYLTHKRQINRGQEELIRICDHHTPIISRELWDATQRRLSERMKRKNGKRKPGTYALSGKIRCGHCGNDYTARVSRQSNGSKVISWCCCARQIRQDLFLQMIRQCVASVNINQEKVQSKLNKVANIARSATGAQYEDYESRIQEIATDLSAKVCGELVEEITVNDDLTVQIRLRHINAQWYFQLEK